MEYFTFGPVDCWQSSEISRGLSCTGFRMTARRSAQRFARLAREDWVIASIALHPKGLKLLFVRLCPHYGIANSKSFSAFYSTRNISFFSTFNCKSIGSVQVLLQQQLYIKTVCGEAWTWSYVNWHRKQIWISVFIYWIRQLQKWKIVSPVSFWKKKKYVFVVLWYEYMENLWALVSEGNSMFSTCRCLTKIEV